MLVAALGLLLQVQMGIAVRPETVTVGQHFASIVRIRAPRGASIGFPVFSGSPRTIDTAGAATRRDLATDQYTEATVTYTLTAWTRGRLPLGLGEVVVQTATGERHVSLAGVTIFVRSVLPADRVRRTPKPARQKFPIHSVDWLRWLTATTVAALALLLWLAWHWYRRRPRRVESPAAWAEREFHRIDTMQLLERRELEQYAILMIATLRQYLIRQFTPIRSSATTRELVSVLRYMPTVPAERTLRLFERGDLLKFAHVAMPRDAAVAAGTESRALVHEIDARLRAEATAARREAQHAQERVA